MMHSLPVWLSLLVPCLLSIPPAVARLERTLAKANCSECEGSTGQEDDEDGQGAGEGAILVVAAICSPALAVAAAISTELESMLRRAPLPNRAPVKGGWSGGADLFAPCRALKGTAADPP